MKLLEEQSDIINQERLLNPIEAFSTTLRLCQARGSIYPDLSKVLYKATTWSCASGIVSNFVLFQINVVNSIPEYQSFFGGILLRTTNLGAHSLTGDLFMASSGRGLLYGSASEPITNDRRQKGRPREDEQMSRFFLSITSSQRWIVNASPLVPGVIKKRSLFA